MRAKNAAREATAERVRNPNNAQRHAVPEIVAEINVVKNNMNNLIDVLTGALVLEHYSRAAAIIKGPRGLGYEKNRLQKLMKAALAEINANKSPLTIDREICKARMPE